MIKLTLTTLITLLSATSILAAPLNINLGAYSPALVVGDGEISFGGAETAAATLATLGGTAAAAAPSAAPGGTTINPAPAKRELMDERSEKEKRDIASFTAALNFAAASLTNSPTVELGTGEGGSGVGIKQIPKGAVAAKPAAKRDGEGEFEERSSGLPTVTLMRVRTLSGGSDGAKKRRALREIVEKDVVEKIGGVDSVNLNFDGDVEFTIAEVKP